MKTFVLVGFLATVIGGFTAALTRPMGFADGAWVAAYLVLVVGVAQISLGAGQALLARTIPSARRRRWELVVYNLANVGVLAGTLTGAVVLVMIGGVALLTALALFITTAPTGRPHSSPVVIYRIFVATLAVSIPVGLSLSLLRHG